MLKLCENGSNIDYLYEISSVLRKATETEISGLTFKNRTEIRFPHIPSYRFTGVMVEVHWVQNNGALVSLADAMQERKTEEY